ncbi:hypothetical protein EB118_03085 [bacterium]|nr:hypothetical protein [bacterium]NDC93949.1 hypothetical protein [bacterium]NDD83444.1 hypothetical protein [bacterium]NDG29069.1 hypothetical protein [bacterium]
MNLEFLFLYDATKDTKKIRKQMKSKFKNMFTAKPYTNLEIDLVKWINFHFHKKHGGKNHKLLVFTDHIDLTHFVVPNVQEPTTDNQTILCIDCSVLKYDYTHPTNTVHWTRAHVRDSHCFIVSGPVPKKEFIRNGVTYVLSRTRVVPKRIQCVPCVPRINVIETIQRAKCIYDKLTPEERYVMLPKISLVCVLTDVDKVFSTIYSFTSLDYPTDHLELVIVDTVGCESALQRTLPADSRIKIIDATQNVSPGIDALNIAVEYSKSDIICNFMDTHVYFIDRFRDLVLCFLASNLECVISGESGIRMTDTSNSLVLNRFDLANAIYTKRFWKVRPFVDNLDSFVSLRESLVGSVPFFFFSFEACGNRSTDTSLPFRHDFLNMLSPSYKKCVETCFHVKPFQ